ncbi:retrovirus-related pol polyprotein from transposon TNT 1-94 [Tanacetum coccineum]
MANIRSSSASSSKAAGVKNKGLIAKAYKWDKEEVSSDDNEMVEVKWYDQGHIGLVSELPDKYVDCQFDEKRGTIFDSNKEVVMISPRDKPCSSCEKGKHHRANFKTKQTSSIKKCLHLLHIDLFGPVTPRSINHEKYTLVIVDEYSRNNILVKFCDEKGISQNFSSPYTPEQNVYIHNHKDHLEKFDEKAYDGYLLGHSIVSKAFRVFNIRRQQTKETYHITFNESPYAIKFLKPTVDNINIAENERYPPDEYLHPYEPSQRYQTNSNDVSFIEPYECPKPVVLETEVSSDQNGQTDQNDHNDQNDQSIFEHSSSPRVEDTLVQNTIPILNPPLPIPSVVTPVPQDIWSQDKYIELVNIIEPKKVFEALKHPGWVDAMQDELNQLARNKVWTLVSAPYGKTIIGSKSVFRNKRDETGIIIKNKARLIAQGYNQQEGIDYDETFAPVARFEAIRIFLAFATYMNFIVYQMYVKSVFLNGKLKEEVHVKQPSGFESNEFPNHTIMANLPPNHNEFAPAAETAPNNLHGWIKEEEEEEDPKMEEEEDPEEDPEMEEEEEEIDVDADEEWDGPEWVLLYQGSDPLNPPPPASDSESEIEFEEAEAEAEAEVEAEAEAAPIPPPPIHVDHEPDRFRQIEEDDVHAENNRLRMMLDCSENRTRAAWRELDRATWHYHNLRGWSIEVHKHLPPHLHYQKAPCVLPSALMVPVTHDDPKDPYVAARDAAIAPATDNDDPAAREETSPSEPQGSPPRDS